MQTTPNDKTVFAQSEGKINAKPSAILATEGCEEIPKPAVIDKVSVKEYTENLDYKIYQLHKQLKSGIYQPQAVKTYRFKKLIL